MNNLREGVRAGSDYYLALKLVARNRLNSRFGDKDQRNVDSERR
jgi:hypothetical protein